MKTTINKKKFIDALTLGGAMAGKNKTMPILEFAKVDITLNTLAIHSFNGESWVTKRSEVVSTDAEYEFCINPSEIINVLKSLAEEEITFSIANTTLIIEHFKGVMEMPIVDAKSYPQAQTTTNGASITLDGDKLKEWLAIATNFVASDELHPVMCGMYIFAQNGKLGVCATDAHKLFTDTIDYEGDAFGVILPASGFKPLANMLRDKAFVNTIVDTKNISFTTNDAELHCRLIEGNYPNFKAVIPQQNNIDIKVCKAELMDSVQRASLMANKTTSLLKLCAEGEMMVIEGSDVDFSKKAKDSVKVEHTGNDITIGVKADFFANCLSTITHDSVTLRMGDERRPIVFVDANIPSRVILVMPMMLS